MARLSSDLHRILTHRQPRSSSSSQVMAEVAADMAVAVGAPGWAMESAAAAANLEDLAADTTRILH